MTICNLKANAIVIGIVVLMQYAAFAQLPECTGVQCVKVISVKYGTRCGNKPNSVSVDIQNTSGTMYMMGYAVFATSTGPIRSPTGYVAPGATMNLYSCDATTAPTFLVNTGPRATVRPPMYQVADQVPGRPAAPKDNHSGLQMLMAAQSHQSEPYGRGMQCSDLIIAASKAAGIKIPQAPSVAGETVTKSWFLHGMGPGFRSVVKDVSLSQLAQDEGNGVVNIPIGSVIVTDGHAALFDGVVKVGNKWQLITYDANSSTGWTVSLTGSPSTTDPKDPMLAFPGHQVGEHVTRLQWDKDDVVSVYQPVGTSPP